MRGLAGAKIIRLPNIFLMRCPSIGSGHRIRKPIPADPSYQRFTRVARSARLSTSWIHGTQRLQDLFEMMPHMGEVVANYEFEIDVLPAGRVPHITKRIRIDIANDHRQMPIVSLPETHDI